MSRHTIAVKRIGDAFASKLDLDALVNTLAGALVEALDAEAGRGRVALARASPPPTTWEICARCSTVSRTMSSPAA